MGYPIVRYAVFSALLMLGGHLVFQHLSQDPQLDLKKVAATLFAPRSTDQAPWSTVEDEVVVPLKWEGVWVANVEINDLHEVKLIVDTGASSTAFSSELAFDIGLSPDSRRGTATVSTASGDSEAWIGLVKSIKLGEAERTNVRVFVMENLGGHGIDGLLGLNFLNGYNWNIDQQAGHLILRPKT